MKIKLFLLFVLVLPSLAYSFDRTKFGVDLSQNSSNLACQNMNDEVINPLWSRSCTDRATGLRLSYNLGFENNYFLEVACVNLGEVKWRGEFEGFPGEEQTFFDRKTVTFSAIGFDVVGRKEFPIDGSSSLFLKAGVISVRAEYKSSEYRGSATSGYTETFTVAERDISPVFGVGYSYKRFVLSCTQYRKVGAGDLGDANIGSLAAGFRF